MIQASWKYFRDKIWDVISLTEGTDSLGTISTIKKGIKIRGANIWILTASTFLASIGLDINSIAVIIGAMLISPLMAPILGIGLGIGISDLSLLWDSLKKFGLAVGISLGVSTIYFLLTPLGQPTIEMAARIEPTLLDVGVAVFGGIAGIVANSRKEATTAIPGVAIATALMPPLCVSGFGLATGDPVYFFGAFYLFFINSVFIALSTYFVVRLLKFPTKQYIDVKTKRKMQTWIAVGAFIIMIPSMYIFYQVIVEAQTNKRIKEFIDENLKTAEYEAVNWSKYETDSTEHLKVYVVGESLNQKKHKKIEKLLQNYNLENFELKIIQMNVSEELRDQMSQELAGQITGKVLNQIAITEELHTRKDKEIDSLNSIIKKYEVDPVFAADLKAELNVLFPEIQDVSFGFISTTSDSLKKTIPITMIQPSAKLSARVLNNYKLKIEEFMKLRFKKDSVCVVLN